MITSIKNRNINKNKKGIIRIIEAFVAVMIVLSVVLIIISRQRVEVSRSDELVKLQKQIIDYVKITDSLRSEILVRNTAGVTLLVNNTVPPWLNYSIRACDVNEICSNPMGIIPKQVYVNELIIAANRTYYPGNATRLVLYFWEK
jgi:hypothetical protein